MEMQDHTAFPDVRSPSISFVGSAVKESNSQISERLAMIRWEFSCVGGSVRGSFTGGVHWRKGSYASGIETDFQVSNKVTPGNCLRGEGYSYTSITG